MNYEQFLKLWDRLALYIAPNSSKINTELFKDVFTVQQYFSLPLDESKRLLQIVRTYTSRSNKTDHYIDFNYVVTAIIYLKFQNEIYENYNGDKKRMQKAKIKCKNNRSFLYTPGLNELIEFMNGNHKTKR